jgi:hypothetical protein
MQLYTRISGLLAISATASAATCLGSTAKYFNNCPQALEGQYACSHDLYSPVSHIINLGQCKLTDF